MIQISQIFFSSEKLITLIPNIDKPEPKRTHRKDAKSQRF